MADDVQPTETLARTPGWYTIENYGKNILRFEAKDGSGWKIVSALDETADSSVFTAPDYDSLVDAPTVMGSFDVERFQVGGKPT